MSITNDKAFHYAVFSSLPSLRLGLKYLTEHPILEHPQVMFLSQCVRLSFIPIQKQTMLHLYIYIYIYFALDAGLLARSQYSEGPATGHLGTGFSWFPCVYKQMLRWFPQFQVATTCFSCIPHDLYLLVTNFIFCIQ